MNHCLRTNNHHLIGSVGEEHGCRRLFGYTTTYSLLVPTLKRRSPFHLSNGPQAIPRSSTEIDVQSEQRVAQHEMVLLAKLLSQSEVVLPAKLL